ncbi:glycosyltransferase, partial [Pseudomonadota bacterium]
TNRAPSRPRWFLSSALFLLEQAIQTVVDQTYRDFEVVIFDDGRHDHSFEVIEDFQKKHPKHVEFFTHNERANKGIVATCRKAISPIQMHTFCSFSSLLETPP